MDYIMRCFGISSVNYEAIHKKDDDICQELATQWTLGYPVREDLSKLASEDIHIYVNQLIKHLNKVPINSSNVTIISDHLIKIGSQSERMRSCIAEKLSKLSCPRPFINDMQFR